MHLINAYSYELQYFFNEKLPKYAILSHTWGDEEVTYQDMTLNLVRAQKKEGFRKIAYTCRQAIQDGLAWAWVDTCCIDKTSSAELSEAINSMYLWYRLSSRCYAYLLDYNAVGTSNNLNEAVFAKSRWFTRGWTLQELIAPETLDFYSHDWVHIGTKSTLAPSIMTVTGISSKFLLNQQPLSEASVAQRMSWAASRQTTRTEDIAYCLLGIFDISMPLLYGEGSRAFYRLQTEIWREYEDDSLLAWTIPLDDPRSYMPTGVLASSPLDFKNSSSIVASHQTRISDTSAITKSGLKLQGPVYGFGLPLGSLFSETRMFRFPLRCHADGHPERPVSILALANHMEDNVALCTRVASPEHYDKGEEGPITTLDPHIDTAYITRSAPKEVVDKFRTLKASMKIYIKLPWKYSRIESYSSDLDKHPDGKMGRDVKVLAAIHPDEKTVLKSGNILLASLSEDIHAFQVLLTVKDRNNEDNNASSQRMFDLRCILGKDEKTSIHQVSLQWMQLVDTEDNNSKSRTAGVTSENFLDYAGLRPDELVPWAQARLGKMQFDSKLTGGDCVADVAVGDGAIMRAGISRGSRDGIFGAMETLRLNVFFCYKRS